MYKKEKGVTLVILVVAVMILMIIAGIIIDSGIKSVKKAELESLKTNLLLIQAKGKEYVENANFHIGTSEEAQKEQIKAENLKGTKYTGELPVTLNEKQEAYELNSSDMNDMGLSNLSDKAQDYIVIYNIEEEAVDVIYKPGITRDNQKYYTLSAIEEAGI